MDDVPDSYRETNHLHLIISAKEDNVSVVLGDFKKFTIKKLIRTILDHPGESPKEWMVSIFKEASEKIAEITITNFGNRIIIR